MRKNKSPKVSVTKWSSPYGGVPYVWSGVPYVVREVAPAAKPAARLTVVR